MAVPPITQRTVLYQLLQYCVPNSETKPANFNTKGYHRAQSICAKFSILSTHYSWLMKYRCVTEGVPYPETQVEKRLKTTLGNTKVWQTVT